MLSRPPIGGTAFAIIMVAAEEMTQHMTRARASLGNDDAGSAQAPAAAGGPLGLNLAFGITPRDLLRALRRFARLLAVNPRIVAKKEAQLAAELGRILLGRSHIKPPPRDLRFRHPIWEQSGYYRRVMQAYLVWRKAMYDILASTPADPQDKARARFLLMQITEAAAPTNHPLGNPGFVDRLVRTHGRSLVHGARNAWRDLRHNGGMPRQVNKSDFRVGRDLAASPGAVVYRSEVCELIQYTPATARVHQRPALFVPPQINKYYIVDLAPDKSFVKYAVEHGVQMFVLSWRNPTRRQAHWNIDTYAEAVLEAIEVAREITGADDVDLIGACAGGLTALAAVGYLQATGAAHKVHSQTLLVSIFDTDQPMLLNLFATDATIAAARSYVRHRGVVDGADMARIFAWLRPTELVWLFFANNYLLGQDPPAFDFLYWNNDPTRISAGFHGDAMDVFQHNPFMKSGAVKVLGRRIDPRRIDTPSFIVAGMKDHIVPWRSCYAATQILGGRKRFVLGASGHIQAVVSPPDKSRARYYVNEDYVADPDDWLHHAGQRAGSWWPYWLDWKTDSRPPEAAAPATLGSARHPAGDPAPGRYVFT